MEISSSENLIPSSGLGPFFLSPAQIGVGVGAFCNQGRTSQLHPGSGRTSPPSFPHVENARGLETTAWSRKDRNWRLS